MKKKSLIQSLRDKGFDLSYNVPFETGCHVKCSQCAALAINGIPCHETGCPNATTGEKCDRCGTYIKKHQAFRHELSEDDRFCSDFCADKAYNHEEEFLNGQQEA